MVYFSMLEFSLKHHRDQVQPPRAATTAAES